jgi:hypothetical protein
MDDRYWAWVGVSWSLKVEILLSTLKVLIVSGQVAAGGFENPQSFADEVFSRCGRGLLDDNFDFCTLRESLVCIKMDVGRCLEWLEMGLGRDVFGSRPRPESGVLAKLKPISTDLGPSTAPFVASLSGLFRVAHSNQVSKGKDGHEWYLGYALSRA